MNTMLPRPQNRLQDALPTLRDFDMLLPPMQWGKTRKLLIHEHDDVRCDMDVVAADSVQWRTNFPGITAVGGPNIGLICSLCQDVE